MKMIPWFQRLAIPCVAAAFHIFYGFQVSGRENIPEGGCVVCPNHCQLSDPPFAAAALSTKYGLMQVMAKKELFSIRFVGPLVAALGAFPVDRSKADVTAIKHALRVVKEGQKLVIFPQGTRGDEETQAKEGAAMLAVRTHAPIVPMYISEGKHFRCHARIKIGKPFLPPEGTRDYQAVSDEIMRQIYALKNED